MGDAAQHSRPRLPVRRGLVQRDRNIFRREPSDSRGLGLQDAHPAVPILVSRKALVEKYSCPSEQARVEQEAVDGNAELRLPSSGHVPQGLPHHEARPNLVAHGNRSARVIARTEAIVAVGYRPARLSAKDVRLDAKLVGSNDVVRVQKLDEPPLSLLEPAVARGG